MTREITMKQLSQMSGYSMSTVSKALKDKDEISDDTKNKIKKLANIYNYVPNNSAKSLRLRRTNILAVIVPQINNIIYSNVISGIQQHAYRRGYRVLIQQYVNCNGSEKSCVESLRDGCVDGIIIIRPSKKDKFYVGDISIPIMIKNVEDLTLNMQAYHVIGEKTIEKLLLTKDRILLK